MANTRLQDFTLPFLLDLLAQERKNLQLLTESATISGGELTASVQVRNSLRITREQIAEIETEIKQRGAAVPPIDGDEENKNNAAFSAQLRKLLTEALSAEEFETLCFDYFRPVFQQFVPGMGQPERILRLLVFLDSAPEQVKVLLNAVQEINPGGYAFIMNETAADH